MACWSRSAGATISRNVPLFRPIHSSGGASKEFATGSRRFSGISGQVEVAGSQFLRPISSSADPRIRQFRRPIHRLTRWICWMHSADSGCCQTSEFDQKAKGGGWPSHHRLPPAAGGRWFDCETPGRALNPAGIEIAISRTAGIGAASSRSEAAPPVAGLERTRQIRKLSVWSSTSSEMNGNAAATRTAPHRPMRAGGSPAIRPTFSTNRRLWLRPECQQWNTQVSPLSVWNVDAIASVKVSIHWTAEESDNFSKKMEQVASSTGHCGCVDDTWPLWLCVAVSFLSGHRLSEGGNTQGLLVFWFHAPRVTTAGR